MIKTRLMIVVAVALAASTGHAWSANAPVKTPAAARKPVQSEHKLAVKVTTVDRRTRKPVQMETEIHYLLYLPEGYEKSRADGKKRWPLMLFLHGAGERGKDINRVKRHGPPKLVEAGRGLPFVIVSPQCPSGRWWNAEVLMALLDAVVAGHAIDEDRIYVTGLSMGGFGTWQLGAKAPKRFAALVPICGGGRVADARKLKDIPIWAFHGGKDRVVSPAKSRQMIEAIRTAGGQGALITIYPEAGHDSWTKTYNNADLYAWLLRQKRRAPARPKTAKPQS